MATDAQTALDEPFVRDFEQRYVDGWNSRRTESLLALMTDDVHWQDPALAQPADGKAAVAEFLLMIWRAMPDVTFSTPEPAFVGTGGVVLAPWHMSGRFTGALDPPGFAPTNQRIELEGVDRWQFRDRLLAGYRAFYDLTVVGRQIGALPRPGTRGERNGVRMQRLAARRLRRLPPSPPAQGTVTAGKTSSQKRFPSRMK